MFPYKKVKEIAKLYASYFFLCFKPTLLNYVFAEVHLIYPLEMAHIKLIT